MQFCIQDPSYNNSKYLHETLLTECVTGCSGAGMLLFVKFYASTFFKLFILIIHKFLIIMQIPCSQFFKLFSTSKKQLYTQF